MIKQALAVAFGLAFAGAAMGQAGTCADPITIESNSTVDLNLCDFAQVYDGFGGVPTPGRTAIYRFIAQDADATLTIATTGGSWNGDVPTMISLPSPCANSTDIIGGGDPDTPLVIPPGSIADGSEHFIAVTHYPGADLNNCGTAQIVVNGVLPVELQSFSVD